MRTLSTPAGPIAVREPAPETLEAFAKLFPAIGRVEDEGEQLLVLAAVHEKKRLEGLRTGYGYCGPQPPEAFGTMLAIERLRVVEAVASFRARKFRGVLVPAACIAGSVEKGSQLGELLFLRSKGALEDGLVTSDTIEGYETDYGPGATDVILTFVKEIIDAWAAAGSGGLLVTDLEPCPADWKGMHWRADVALVDDRVFVIRRELVPEDPLLAALVASGVSEVEFTPCVFLLPEPDAIAPR